MIAAKAAAVAATISTSKLTVITGDRGRGLRGGGRGGEKRRREEGAQREGKKKETV